IGEAESFDITDDISESIKKNIQKIIAAIPGLSTAAVDVMTDDYKNSAEINLISISASPNPLVSYITRKGKGVNIYDNYISSLLVRQKVKNNYVLEDNEGKLFSEIEHFSEL